MGTRGLLAFHSKGETKATYNHWDSYPGGLGAVVLNWLRQIHNYDVLRERVANLRAVTNDQPPTAEQQDALRQFANRNVSTQQMDDWYVLLRETQGDPDKILAAGYYEDALAFGFDSLMCEWGYVVDLDAESFDVYQGFNTTGKAEGLWADRPSASSLPSGPFSAQYDSITRVASFPLADLPEPAAFVVKVDPDVEA